MIDYVSDELYTDIFSDEEFSIIIEYLIINNIIIDDNNFDIFILYCFYLDIDNLIKNNLSKLFRFNINSNNYIHYLPNIWFSYVKDDVYSDIKYKINNPSKIFFVLIDNKVLIIPIFYISYFNDYPILNFNLIWINYKADNIDFVKKHKNDLQADNLFKIINNNFTNILLLNNQEKYILTIYLIWKENYTPERILNDIIAVDKAQFFVK